MHLQLRNTVMPGGVSAYAVVRVRPCQSVGRMRGGMKDACEGACKDVCKDACGGGRMRGRMLRRATPPAKV